MDTIERELLFQQLRRAGRRVNELTGKGSDVADRVIDVILPFLDLLELPATTDGQIDDSLAGLRNLVDDLSQSSYPIQTMTAEAIRTLVPLCQKS